MSSSVCMPAIGCEQDSDLVRWWWSVRFSGALNSRTFPVQMIDITTATTVAGSHTIATVSTSAPISIPFEQQISADSFLDSFSACMAGVKDLSFSDSSCWQKEVEMT